jgi:hypothetical protein
MPSFVFYTISCIETFFFRGGGQARKIYSPNETLGLWRPKPHMMLHLIQFSAQT